MLYATVLRSDGQRAKIVWFCASSGHAVHAGIFILRGAMLFPLRINLTTALKLLEQRDRGSSWRRVCLNTCSNTTAQTVK